MTETGVFQVDPLTGQTDLIVNGTTSNLATIPNDRGASITFGNDMIYGLSQMGVFQVDPLTGQTDLIASNHLATIPNSRGGSLTFYSPVPLPAGIYLFLSGLVVLGLMRGRS